MMRKYLLWLGLGWMLAGCEGLRKPPTPSLPVERLVPVLAEIHLAEAYLVDVRDLSQKDSLARVYYAQILDRNQLTPADFDANMRAYLQDPAATKKLYTKVLEYLQKEER